MSVLAEGCSQQEAKMAYPRLPPAPFKSHSGGLEGVELVPQGLSSRLLGAGELAI